MYDVIIIGAGPAGISAGIYAKRGNLKVLVIYNSFSELEKAVKIDNYYGFPNGISGKELYDNGILQAENLGVELKKVEILDLEITEDGFFSVKSKEESFNSKALIIATGNKKMKPNILRIGQV